MQNPPDDWTALIDLDGTTADYDRSMREHLELLRAPNETPLDAIPYGNIPDYLEARMDLIKRQPGFWRSLPTIPVGIQVANFLQDQLGFRLMVLTKGPKRTTAAWSEKVEWSQEHLPHAGVTITFDHDKTRDKGGTYGKVLCDDYPPYIINWLKHRPRGLVLMLDNGYNREFEHPNVLRILREDELSIQQVTLIEEYVRRLVPK